MVSVRIVSITTRIKGHHVFHHNCEVGEEFVCCLEPGNRNSPCDNPIVAVIEAVVGHTPEPLVAQILGPMLGWSNTFV